SCPRSRSSLSTGDTRSSWRRRAFMRASSTRPPRHGISKRWTRVSPRRSRRERGGFVRYAPAMGALTTHVLDIYHGIAAAAVPVELARLDGSRQSLVRTATNAEGRCARPLLEGEAMTAGIYELAFDLESYFRAKGVELPR